MRDEDAACPACGGRIREERPYLGGIGPILIYFFVPLGGVFLTGRWGAEARIVVGAAWVLALLPILVTCVLPGGYRFLWLGARACGTCAWFRLGAREHGSLERTRRVGLRLCGGAAVALGLAGGALWIFKVVEYIQTRQLARPTDAILAGGLMYGALGCAALRPAFRPNDRFRAWGQ